VLARKLARWCADHAEEIRAVDGPELLPPGVFNREGDNWRPLLAVARVAGGDWPERARKAVEQSRAAADDESRIAVLLGDIRAIFTAERNTDRLRSADLCEALQKLEGQPWAEYGKSRKPISQNQLARLLKPLGIVPEVFRDEAKTPRGYMLVQFSDAFDRYLPPLPPSKPQHRNKCDEQRTSGPFQTATSGPNVAVGKCKKSNNDGKCCGVAAAKGGVSKNATREGRRSAGSGRTTGFLTWCEHCGGLETTYNLIRPHLVGGGQHWLHAGCRTAWLTGRTA
jgi:Protein of unknown function (DUF3631)